MGLLDIILSALVALFAGLNIFQIFSFRAYKKKFQAQAEMEEAVAYAEKQSALEQRLAAIERLYNEQGATIDALREQILKLSEEKFNNASRIVQLEGENKLLREKQDRLEKEVEAYKTLVNSK